MCRSGRARHHGCRHRRGGGPHGHPGDRRRAGRGRASRGLAGTSSTRPSGRAPAASSTRPPAPRCSTGSPTRRDLADLADADLVIEAIPESLELKARVFTELEEVCRPDVILASNTSSLSVTEIGVHTGRPGKVVGLHFFNPAPVLKLVEIVRTVVTEPDVVADVEAFARAARQGAGRDRRPGRVHRERAAVRLPQPRGVDVRVALRHARGPRRRHALRLRLPDGPAGAARPDRAGHRLRDPRDDVPPVPQPAARAGADPASR